MRLPPDHALTLFRIAQESLTNAVRHAGARSVRLGIAYSPAEATLLVQDDGTGFDQELIEQEGTPHSLGLAGMAERARLLGGTFDLESTPGWGTRVRASIPLSSTGGRPHPPGRTSTCWSWTTIR